MVARTRSLMLSINLFNLKVLNNSYMDWHIHAGKLTIGTHPQSSQLLITNEKKGFIST
jgi:hypothetical protein